MPGQNSFEALIEAWWAKLKSAFMSSVRSIIDFAQVGRIAERLEKGDIEGAVREIDLDPVSLREFDKAIADAFEDGGRFTIKQVPTVREPSGHRLTVQFDVRNERAESWLKEHSSNLVKDVLDDQRNMIRETLRAGMAAGKNPRDVALDLVGRIGPNGKRSGGSIGLTSSQDAWVRAYEAELSSASPAAALKRKLRDKRFDAAVMRADKAGEAVAPELKQKMVTAYRNRALRYRAETIARTEALASLHQSQDEAFQQAIDKGAVEVRAITRTWNSAADKKVRDTHREMDGQEVGFNDDFTSPSGALLAYPGDPSAPAAEIINCRCTVALRINHAIGVR